MIRWILDTKWVPEIALSLTLLVVFGGIDAVTSGISYFLLSTPFALASLFVRKYSYFTGAMLFVGAALHFGFSAVPSFGNLVLAVVTSPSIKALTIEFKLS